MTTQALSRREAELLVWEARRYLAAVDVFRAEGCEPASRSEQGPRTKGRHARRIDTPSISELGLDPG
jgi:hypothetical protein